MKKSALLVLITSVFLILSCNNGSENSLKKAKYIFLFIGDGMSLPQVHLTEIYLGRENIPGKSPSRLSFTKFPSIGITTTHSQNSWITDSAAAGTAIACGYKTSQRTLGMDHKKKNSFKSIAFYAKKNGLKTGIVTSVSIDHATPASFYAHQPSRKNYWEIVKELPDSGFDFFAAGGVKDPEYRNEHGLTKSQFLQKSEYKVTFGKDKLMELKKGDKKIIAFAKTPTKKGDLPYEIDRKDDQISLKDFTDKAIELLDNPKGFFIMVEGGKIDWAAHSNDTGTMLQDTVAFDQAIKRALDFYDKHPDETVIVITGDHECGGFTLGRDETRYDMDLNYFSYQKISTEKFSEIVKGYKNDKKTSFEQFIPLLHKYFGFKWDETHDEQTEGFYLKPQEIDSLKTAYGEFFDQDSGTESLYSYEDPLTVAARKILSKRAGVGNSSGTHTGIPVITYAIGSSSRLFRGYYDNTEIFSKLMKAAQLKK